MIMGASREGLTSRYENIATENIKLRYRIEELEALLQREYLKQEKPIEGIDKK